MRGGVTAARRPLEAKTLGSNPSPAAKNMANFKKLKIEILDILKKSPLDFEVIHANLVHKWVLVLQPNADEALQIAALSHDMDRAITGITEKDLKDYSQIENFKSEHAKRSAKFISEILKKNNYSKEIVSKVAYLVSNHETGGDNESNTLMNADSIAYFENNISSYLKRNGLERTKSKIEFMYHRMSPEARKKVKRLAIKSKEIRKLIEEL